jgi:hypothetical protein
LPITGLKPAAARSSAAYVEGSPTTSEPTLGDQLVQVGLEAVGELGALVDGEVGEPRADLLETKSATSRPRA